MKHLSCAASLASALWVFFGLASLSPAPAQQRRNSDCIHNAAIPFLQRRAPDTACFATMLSTPVHEDYNLLVVRGVDGCEENEECEVSERLWWSPGDLLGLFLQERENPDRVHELTIVRNRALADASFKVERFTGTEIVFTHIPVKGWRPPSLRFFFDAASKSFRGQVEYRNFRTVGVAGGRQSPQFVLRNDYRFSSADDAPILVFRPAEGGGFEAVPESEWAPEIDDAFGTWWSNAGGPVRFGPQGRFSVETAADRGGEEAIGVREGTDFYRLPQSDAEEWRAARPEKQRWGADSAEFEEVIGPRQVFDGRLWFGKTFYDSEGYSGVGGFGYFDPSARRYVIFSPPAIRDSRKP